MPQPRQSLTASLTLADDGVFTVGARRVTTDHPGSSPRTGSPGRGDISVDQMYVHYRIPVELTKPPIVMVHGSNATGAMWETTPDGREGWATWFVRRGHPVYVVDHAGRGRSGFDPTRINARDGVPDIFLSTYERHWVNGRLGPAYPTAFPGVLFPLDHFDRFMASKVPNAESTLEHGGGTTPAALAELLDEVGPAILMVHSMGGLYGIEAAQMRPAKTLALVSIEGGAETLTAHQASEHFKDTPFLSLWGDNSFGAELVNGDERRQGCRRAVDLINAGGGVAELVLLPERSIRGNTHYLMMDTNSLELAETVERWLTDHVREVRPD